MPTTLLVVDDRHVPLSQRTNISRLRDRLAKAVRSGGRFVTVEPASGNPIEFLIGPQSQVRIEIVEPAEDNQEFAGQSEGIRFDFDL
jgi:hypothetical protein